jgi:hypothetical protein
MTLISKETAIKFCKLCNWAYEAWTIRRTLFEDNPSHEAQFKECPDFFFKLGIITQEYALQLISKLHDPAIQRDSLNLSIDYMVRFGDWGEKESKIRDLQRKLKELGDLLSKGRNKLLAHNDLESIVQGKPLGVFEDCKDIEYFKTLQTFVDEVHEKWIGGPYPFNDLAINETEEFCHFLSRTVIHRGMESIIAENVHGMVSLKEALDLLGLKEVPGGEADAGLIFSGMNRLIRTYGLDWVKANRVRLVEELEILKDF